MQTRFSTIDGETLMNQPLQSMQFAVDSNFTLVEEKRGSGKATLSCICRDIVLFISDFMTDKQYYQGSPIELAGLISRKENNISHRTFSRLMLQNQEQLSKKGIDVRCHRSNGSRWIPTISHILNVSLWERS